MLLTEAFSECDVSDDIEGVALEPMSEVECRPVI